MNSQLQSALDITSQTHTTNPFVLKLPANSTSQEHIHLSISCYILKKLALVDITKSRETADLYKECLLDVIQSPLVDLKCKQIIDEILYFLQYWQQSLGKAASWPHTRTCFYFLEEKLKKNKLFEQLDMVRLKRAKLEPNKKQFLTQIMVETIHTEELKVYIALLKEDYESQSEYSFSMNKRSNKEQNNLHIAADQSQTIDFIKLQNILYSDTHEDWNYFIKMYSMQEKKTEGLISQQNNQDCHPQFEDIIQTYLQEKLPILINQLKASKTSKDKIIQEIMFRKSVIEKIVPSPLVQILNMTISKIKYNHI